MSENYFFQNPVDQPWNVSSQVGGRIDPVYGYNASHKGIDIAVPIGTPIMAAAGGTILYSKVDGSASGGYGQYVAIKHDNGTITLYGHLSDRDVVAGQRVEVGQQIGLSGNTGKSTGPHLHFQITEGDNPFTGKVINPIKI